MVDPQIIASIITGVIALVAVLVGPWVTLRASRNQMLGPMRQAWINDLRDTVAEFCAHVSVGYDGVSALTRDENVYNEVVRGRVEHIQTTANLLAKIGLLINPNEQDHRELVRLARVAFEEYERGGGRPHLAAPLIEHTQSVLKTEWNVVKK